MSEGKHYLPAQQNRDVTDDWKAFEMFVRGD